MSTKKNDESKGGVAAKPDGTVSADYGVPEGAGFENVGMEDLVLPRLNVLQALSPQVNEKPGDGGVEGAKAGMLHNSVTEELYDGDGGVVFIPACTTHVFTEWVPRKRGGGFVGIHAIGSEMVEKAKANKPEGSRFGRFSTDYTKTGDDSAPFQGNDLVETFEVYGVLCREEGPLPCVITITSTKIKVYRGWMTSIKAFRPKQNIPLFAHRVLVTTTSQKHAEGTSFNLKLQPALLNEGGQRTLTASLLVPGGQEEGAAETHDELLKLGREVYEMARDGRARANYESGSSEAPAGGGGSAGTDEEGNDIPF